MYNWIQDKDLIFIQKILDKHDVLGMSKMMLLFTLVFFWILYMCYIYVILI